MILFKDPSYIVNGDTSSSIEGPWIRCTACDAVLFHVSWSSGGGTAGNVSIEGTNDEAFANPVVLGVTFSEGGPSISTSSAGSRLVSTISHAGSAAIPLPEFVRLKFNRSDGGAANQLQVAAIGR
jgi:hypothetical protein